MSPFLTGPLTFLMSDLFSLTRVHFTWVMVPLDPSCQDRLTSSCEDLVDVGNVCHFLFSFHQINYSKNL
jgi:hypothetical protein